MTREFDWPPIRRRSPNGCGPWWMPARSAGTWSTVISCTHQCHGMHQQRGEYLIASHNPLRETLVSQLGPDSSTRHQTLARPHTATRN
jgi:hypothetical protein